MSTLFDSAVYNLRNQIPFVRPSMLEFMRALASNGTVTLTCDYRHSVSTRYWWTLTWIDDDGETYNTSAQELDLCFWRAVQRYKMTNHIYPAVQAPVNVFEGGLGI